MKIGRFLHKHLLFLLMIGLVLASQTLAQTTNRAALVVSFGEGQVETACVEFTEPEITGLEVLQRAGMDVEAQVQGLGAAVCRIDGTGCPGNNCFCQCTGGGDCRFWNYWHLVNGQWQFSQVGGGIYPVQDGAVEGWSWGAGTPGGNGEKPPVYTFDQICEPPATDTPMPTNTAVSPTNTPAPATPTAIPAPQIDFRADAATVAAGTCTTLRWDVEYVTAVFLNDIGVEGHGSQQVCPAQSESYTLRITHPQGEENRQITVSVIAPTATTVLPTPAVGQQIAANPATATLLATVIPTLTAPFLSPTIPATIRADETAVPTNQATPTREFVEVIVPLLPTATEAATAVAALPPPTVTSASPPTEVPSIAPSQWLAYAIFGMIIFGLVAMLLLAKR
jgi:hypothetical protein